MTEPLEPTGPADPPTPQPTTVTGYPAAAAPVAQANPGMASLRSQVRTLRVLLIACVALLVVLMVGFAVAATQANSQLAALSDEVGALSAAASARAAAPVPTPSAAAAAPKAQGVEQLSAAVDLPVSAAVPRGVDATGAVLLGDPNAEQVLEVYVDYQCPFCQKWERTIGEAAIAKALEPGSGLLVKEYVLAFLGETSSSLEPAGASARAGNAAVCVLDADGAEAFARYSAALFEKADPAEPPGQFTEDVLVQLAQEAGASSVAVQCIRDETFVPFVAASTKAGFARGVGGTPTVVVNGTTVGNPFTDPDVTGFGAGA
jgi:protein-disulfide isomerase